MRSAIGGQVCPLWCIERTEREVLRQLRRAARVAERDITRSCDADFIGKDCHRKARSGRRRGERKTVTALFADIKGSTELMRDLDPGRGARDHRPGAAAHDRRGASLRRLRRAIDRRRHLRAVRRAGRPRGPSAARALCGAGDAAGVARYADRCARRARFPRGARGRQHRRSGGAYGRDRRPYRVHAGRPRNQSGFTDADRGAGGFDRGERSDARLCEGYFELRALGPTAVKGLSEPINVYEVVGLGRCGRTSSWRRGAG